jgi:hypothetical protein
MSGIVHESDFSRRRVFIVIVSILMGFLLAAGIPIGVVLFAAGIASLFTFTDQGMGDIILTFGFSMLFLGLIPYSVLAATRTLKQHQIRIHDDHVEFSYSPGPIPWKISWRELWRDEYPYYMLSNHSISLVDRDLKCVNVTVHSGNAKNRGEIRIIGKYLKKMGFRRISLDEWASMIEEKNGDRDQLGNDL